MDDRKDQPEPTMEEILASIRRIISEDTQDENGDAEPQAAAEPEPESMSPVEEEPPPEEPSDDIFELTEVADQPEPQDLDIPDTALDDLDLSEPEPDLPEPDLPDLPDLRPDPEPEPEFEPAAAPESGLGALGDEGRLGDDEAIISPGPEAAATAAFAGLMGSMPRNSVTGDMPIGNSGLTLEELVRQMMRPMLREWLDANLPGLVERLVKREIERMVRRAED